jgi:hypothetical protein
VRSAYALQMATKGFLQAHVRHTAAPPGSQKREPVLEHVRDVDASLHETDCSATERP